MKRSLSVLLFVVFARVTSAQEVPRLTFDLGMGSGPHTERVDAHWFKKDHNAIFHVGGAVRVATFAKRFGAIVRYDYSSGGMADQISICEPAPDLTCRQYFPKTEGPSIGAGVASAVFSDVFVEATAGVIRSTNNRYVGVAASCRLGGHLGLVADWRYFSREYGAERVWYRPLQFGIRIL
jgi:hypothetical protein